MYCPQSVVYHVGGGTLPKKSSKKTYLNMRNNNVMLFKNLPSDRLLKVYSARLILDGIAAIKFLFDGGFGDFFAVIRAHWKFFSMIPELRKERKITNHFSVSKIYKKNLVFEYFLKGKRKFTNLKPELFS